MTSHKCVAALLLLIGLFSAFNLADYLYPEEANAAVSYSNFTMNATAYSIVEVNGVDTFVLKNGEPMTNLTRIEGVLYNHYIRTYYPSEADLNELKGLVKRFNDSRNDGYDFKGKEEYICRDDVVLSNGKITVSGEPVRCTDNESCTKNAMLLFGVYGEGLGLGSPTVIMEPLASFTPVSLKIDGLVTNYSTMLEEIDESNVATTLEYIADTSGELEDLSLQIEATLFRTPRLNDTQDRNACMGRCWAICPSFDLDQDAAQEIAELSGQLASNLGPFSEYKSAAASIYNQTSTRMEHVRQDNMEVYYTDVFQPLNESGTESISLAKEALGHLQNRTLLNRLDELESLHATIPEDIAAHNFSTLEADMASYEAISAEVNGGAVFLLEQYNETVEAKNLENSLLIILESKDLDPVSLTSLGIIRNKTSDLDAEFHDGMTLAELDALEGNYTELANSAQDLLKAESDTPATRVLLLFRGFARKVNTGIANVAENSEIMPPSEIPESPTTLGLFSLLVFLSFSSVALLFFLYLFSTMRFTIPKTPHILLAAFACIIVLIFIFSLMMYLFLGKTSSDATLPEFLSDFSSKDSTEIFVNLDGASISDAAAMQQCAANLANSFGEKNKTWTIYTITPNTCTRSDSSGGSSNIDNSECTDALDEAGSSFLLAYSQKNEPPRFSVIYQNRAEISANLDYYESCPLVALFS